MRYAILLVIMLACLCGCATTGNTSGGGGSDGTDSIDPNAAEDQKEREAYEVTGDVRVYYYVKRTLVKGAFRTTENGERTSGPMVEQEEQHHVLVNKSHTFYMHIADQDVPPEERFLRNTDMYDLLRIFKELGFFKSGSSVNIFGDDPIERADRERTTSRVIAVEIIKDGKVNTSYFARHENEHESDRDRAKMFNDCQAVLMQAIAGALPRGNADYGAGDINKIHKPR
ncbi:MAG: hypothetical protein KDB90_01985 [Planctomycetes bacterium]|nr:hypothetical protein [Planctomycetota bacterium]